MRPNLRFSMVASFLLSSAAVLAQEKLNESNDQALNPLSATTASDLKAFAERPLFSSARRPTSEKRLTTAVEPAESLEPTLEFKLLGVTFGPDGAVASISSGTTRYSVREGENVEGWTLKKIDVSHVIIERNEEINTLRIFAKNEVNPPVTQDGQDEVGAGPGIVFESAEPSEERRDAPPVRVIQSN
ncbi:hypothetical protein IHQ71_31615 (plasmid) [Rhizobium sp. TH2]|uniref:type II secretion system protein N n=1 Tax=Rhizobium sp. TH2 TaxID=2775403 RepID=UPI0021572107|nr:type II secretion system protein N [Rhizobium sp. TH2]UVC12618.1 hypothetical protein IHQ71_31615 [Rhizobium sp. TH2]